MIININDTFYIDKDNYGNHTLHERTGKFKADKDGQNIEVTKTHGFHRSVDRALECLTHLNVIRAHEKVSLSKYIQLVRNEREQLRKLVEDGGEVNRSKT